MPVSEKMASVMAAEPTAMMASAGLSFVDVLSVAQHVVKLLESQGQACLDIVAASLKLIKAVSGRDMLGCFAALREVTDDVTKLIAAVKEEFGI